MSEVKSTQETANNDNEVLAESNLSVEILYNSKEKSGFISGGDSLNPSWDEYLDRFDDKFVPHFKLIKQVLEKSNHIGDTGEDQQNLGISFKFSDGNHFSFTWRGWGDLMQAIVNKREGYMKYYM